MASRFTSSPAMETLPKSAAVTGSSPAVTSHWVRSSVRHAGAVPAGAAPYSSSATATNDNQNPASSGASGSSSNTIRAATPSVPLALTGRASDRSRCHSVSITSVRWVGIENPASNA